MFHGLLPVVFVYNYFPFSFLAGHLFDYHLLDMFEFGVESFQSMNSFKVVHVGLNFAVVLLKVVVSLW